jgi:PIN domain nuclease of toxin-antitoxin system
VRVLLDTHVLLWCLGGDRRLDRKTAALLRSPATDVFFSAASVWELAIKASLGKFRGDLEEVLRVLETEGFGELPVTARHAAEVSTLPLHHRDPFDRLLVAQGRVEGLRLYTDDTALERYGEPVFLLR